LFKDRIKQLRKEKNSTLEKFGEKIGIGRDAYANLEYGRVEPSEIVIRAICSEFGVDYLWLKDGIGEMFASEENEVLAALDDLMTSENEETKALIRALAKLSVDELKVVNKLIKSVVEELSD